MTKDFEIRVCENPACGLRYPLVNEHPFGERCPLCLGSTIVVRRGALHLESSNSITPPLFNLEVLLDNIRSAWNVGAIFRTSDGFRVQKLHLCGITPTPANASVGKTALGAETSIPWSYSRNAFETALELKKSGARLWALEQDVRAVPIYSSFEIDSRPVVLIVGNEVSGVDPDLLDLCERIVQIPMLGKKRSLNVEVAYGAALAILRNPNP